MKKAEKLKKNYQAMSKSLIAERKKYRACIRDILMLEESLCQCIDASTDRDLVDPSCQAHDWAVEIKEVIKGYGFKLKRMNPQDVYFIQTADEKTVKIGVAKSPIQRLAEMQVGNPVELELLAIVYGGGGDLEHELHRKFRKHRIRGEWFKLTPVIQEWIGKYANKIPVHR